MDADRREGAVLSVVRTVAETGSTNADLLALAAAGAVEGTWLRAERQTAGRGREGRTWVSEPGNLYASTLVRVRVGEPAAATLALAAGVALHESVALLSRSPSGSCSPAPPASGEGLRLKWPNDLLLDGAKLAGILLERQGDVVVAGFGVNLTGHPDLPDRPATSLGEHDVVIGAEPLGEMLADTFARWLARWRSEGLAPVRRAWLERAHPIGTALTARLPDGTAADGLFDGLDAEGALVLRLAGGERRVIHAGDVFLL